MCICVYAYINIRLYICVCLTIIIKKEVIHLRFGGRRWERSKGEDLKGVEKRDGKSDVVIF